MVVAITQDKDSNKVVNALSENNFSVTRLKSTGGFLRAGNTTILCGVEDEKVDTVIEIIKKESKTRTELITLPMPVSGTGIYSALPIDIEVGGATIFVLDVERFEKV